MNSISVVLTCFSEGDLIVEAIDSIRNQSLKPAEIILVNDASSDRSTLNICHELECQDDIQVIWRSANGGPSVARNDGFRAAKGEILVPLDSDDLLPEKALEHIWHTATRYPDIDFFYGDYLLQNQPDDIRIVKMGDISLSTMLKAKRFSLSSNWTLIGTAPLRKRLWKKLGECDEKLGVNDLHDLEFWIRAIAIGENYIYIPENIYTWRKYLGSNSRQVTPMSWYRIAEKHFDIYRQFDLEYRAYELLLLGSQWLNDSSQVISFRKKLLKQLLNGQVHLSSFLALLIPGFVVRSLVPYLRQRR